MMVRASHALLVPVVLAALVVSASAAPRVVAATESGPAATPSAGPASAAPQPLVCFAGNGCPGMTAQVCFASAVLRSKPGPCTPGGRRYRFTATPPPRR